MKDPVAEHAKDTQNDPAHPGKVIYVNKGDIDGNEIPNFADAGNRGPGFAQVVMTFPDGIDLNAFKVKFKYDMNRPSDILQTGDAQDGFAYTPTKKGIRLWRHNASVVNGQMFLASDQSFTLAELTPTLVGDEFRPKYYELRLFVEGVTASDFCGDKSLIVYANARADWEPNNFVPADSIAFTVVEANIEITRKNGTIVPEHKEEYNGTVVQLVPQNNPSGLYPQGIFLNIAKLEVKPTGMASVMGFKMSKDYALPSSGKIRIYKQGVRVSEEDDEALVISANDFSKSWKIDSTRGGIADLALVAEYPPNIELGRDSVRISSVPGVPSDGRIIFVNTSSQAPAPPYRNLARSAAHTIQEAVAAMNADDNVLIIRGAYNENDIGIAKAGTISGLGGKWLISDPTVIPQPPPATALLLADHFDYSSLPVIDGSGRLAAPLFRCSGQVSGSKLSFGGLRLSGGDARVSVPASGGAIRMDNLGNAFLDMSFCSIDGNLAHEFGGAVYLDSVKSAKVYVSSFHDNVVNFSSGGTSQSYFKGMGGAIASIKSVLSISESIFQDNSALTTYVGLRPAFGAAGGGGDLYIQKGQLNLTRSRSSAAIAGYDIVPNVNAGPDYFTGDGGSILVHGEEADTTFTISETTFENATAYGNGGTICISFNSSPEGRFYFVGPPYFGSQFPPVEAYPQPLMGGCVGTIVNCLFTGSQGGWQGGAISANGTGVKMTISESTFKNGKGGTIHQRDGKGGAVAVGGGIQASAEPLNHVKVQGCSIRNNQASGNGGGLYVTIRGKLSVENTKVLGCQALNEGGVDFRKFEGMGGGIHATAGGHVHISGSSELALNTAAASGGGLSVKSARAYLTDSATIQYNKALGAASDGFGNGGGIYVTTSYYDDTPFTGPGWGAATLYNEHGSLESESSQVAVRYNEANRWGGGIYAGLSNPWYSNVQDPSMRNVDKAKVTFHNGLIKENSCGAPGRVTSFLPAQAAAERVQYGPDAFLSFLGTAISGNALTDIGIYTLDCVIPSGGTFTSLKANTIADIPPPGPPF